jgi:hypothetical protein
MRMWQWLKKHVWPWYRFDTPQGVLNWQMQLNTGMLAVVILFHPQPWVALALLLGLFAAALWLHGPAWRRLLVLYAALGWAGEIWVVKLGGVWAHAAPVACPALWGLPCGGLLGVPLFMLPAWGLIGALLVALIGYMPPRMPTRK